MTTKIFVNLPVKDIVKTKQFFTKLGFTFNDQFTNESAVCMIINPDSYVMLLTYPRFQEFTKKEIADTEKTCQVLVAISAERKENVDNLFEKAIKAGGKEARETQDYGFMYGRSFEDINGHIWEAIWVDSATISKDK